MARTPRTIDWEKLELYLKSGCTQETICKNFGISDDALRAQVKKKYNQEYQDFAGSLRSEGIALIEATQMKKALQGNITMLLWLGKIRCNQREPEPIQYLAPKQDDIDKDHRIMELEYKLAQAEANANKPQTKSEL